ncbi:hypothetical protein V6x_23010 [Gimesia chilikensis]|uniref:Uncharacterized protein n=1 Tax=Gimesia chilikensis TaxID=2605989 RepID=A0A517WBG5_9PLAN|nr:hypothetical protein [Gimesia chilikensis]QDU02596.1 hypothetical protein V6x_23010 [Gimesia chilikensis]
MEQLTKIFVDLYQYGIVLAMVIALWGVLSWPGIRGKGWLVGALLVTLSAELGSTVLQQLIRLWFGPEQIMGPDDYQYLWQASFVLGGLSFLGKLLFVVSVFRLRAGLRSKVSPMLAGAGSGGE